MSGVLGVLVTKFTVVIGAGVSGLSLALELIRRGRSVVLLDQKEAGSESTWAGGGILSPLLPWEYPDAVSSLALRAMRQWSDWVVALQQESGQNAEYRRCGMRTYNVKHAADVLAWCGNHGLTADFDSHTGNLWLPDISQVRNPRLVKVLRASFLKLGGRLYEHCPASAILASNGITFVRTHEGDFAFDQLAICTGAWAGLGLTGLPATPNILPICGQMLLFKLPANSLDTILYRQGLYIIPRLDGHILVGSTLENNGFKKTMDVATAQRLHAKAAELLPILAEHQPIRHWAGLRPGSPDNIPVIGQHPDFENVFINTGHYRYGVTMAPASAELLADLMEGKTPALDPTPYSWAAAEQRRWTDRL